MSRVPIAAAMLSAAMAQTLIAGGNCGGSSGGGGFCGFGDSSYPFALPKVEEEVSVGGLTLKLDRVKWGYSVFAAASDGRLARFVGDDIEITLRQIAPVAAEGSMLIRSLASRSDVLYIRPVATSGALRGVKVAYGSPRSALPREQTAVNYFIAVSKGSWLCFDARPTGRSPEWREANDLVLGARLDRSAG